MGDGSYGVLADNNQCIVIRDQCCQEMISEPSPRHHLCPLVAFTSEIHMAGTLRHSVSHILPYYFNFAAETTVDKIISTLSISYPINQRANRSTQEVIKKRSMNSPPNEMDRSISAEQTSQITPEANLPSFSQHDLKPTIIGMQPLPTSSSVSDTTTKIHEGTGINSEENSKQRKSGGLSQFCAELGSCCVSLLSSC
ncbi:hypothetical protein X798_01429 [Onchocerca flexuosa]|uniref:Uncharacterized protein n=1 Tax=Onchocerca flexuosa TaxID=387005 RepID=A0A238C280_9BILA|nr:hypothetical protein X798_01429 [Onchocerca flexuosa]